MLLFKIQVRRALQMQMCRANTKETPNDTSILRPRLVYAPPASIGEYGGEIDNWMWPRHTGDFSLLRAYVGPDGDPAEFSEANVPVRSVPPTFERSYTFR